MAVLKQSVNDGHWYILQNLGGAGIRTLQITSAGLAYLHDRGCLSHNVDLPSPIMAQLFEFKLVYVRGEQSSEIPESFREKVFHQQFLLHRLTTAVVFGDGRFNWVLLFPELDRETYQNLRDGCSTQEFDSLAIVVNAGSGVRIHRLRPGSGGVAVKLSPSAEPDTPSLVNLVSGKQYRDDPYAMSYAGLHREGTFFCGSGMRRYRVPIGVPTGFDARYYFVKHGYAQTLAGTNAGWASPAGPVQPLLDWSYCEVEGGGVRRPLYVNHPFELGGFVRLVYPRRHRRLKDGTPVIAYRPNDIIRVRIETFAWSPSYFTPGRMLVERRRSPSLFGGFVTIVDSQPAVEFDLRNAEPGVYRIRDADFTLIPLTFMVEKVR